MMVGEGDIAWLNTINSLIVVEETLAILQNLYGCDSLSLPMSPPHKQLYKSVPVSIKINFD